MTGKQRVTGYGIAFDLCSEQFSRKGVRKNILIALGVFKKTINCSLGACAAFYFPMAMLATVIFGTITGASPHIVLPGIFRAGPIYLVSVALIFGLYCMEAFSGSFLPDGFWGSISAAIIAMFVVMTTARTLGLLYFHREMELGWVYERETRAGG